MPLGAKPYAPAGGEHAGVAPRRLTARHADSVWATTDALLQQFPSDGAPSPQALATIAELIHAATHDVLTGLPTRGVLVDRLQVELSRAFTTERLAVLFIDLDNFKLVNDSLGHDSGDALLREVARRVGACVGPHDTVSRFGGDELVILHARAHAGSETALAQRVLAAMLEPVHLTGRELVTSVSIGVAVCAPGAQTAEQLLRDADTALYAAKSRGKNRLEHFNDELHARVARRVRLESDLRVALRDEQLKVYFQPQVDLTTGYVVGTEALARWTHPELGPVSPAEFIPVAEDSRLIPELGRQVLWCACRQLAEWAAAFPTLPLSMTVNISPRQLDQPDFIAQLQAVLDETGINPSSLCLELTESALMVRQTDIVGVLERVHQMGVYVAIDDFGTEHSSLSRLRSLPVEVLKIDRSFIDGLPSESGDTAIVSSILSLAVAMGKHVIAEGIERTEQAMALRNMGCTVAQGYLFCAPVEATRIAGMLDRPLWQPDVEWKKRSAAPVPTRGPGRRAYRAFIDEFLDHIGVRMAGRKDLAP